MINKGFCPFLTAAERSVQDCMGAVCELAITDKNGKFESCAFVAIAKNTKNEKSDK